MVSLRNNPKYRRMWREAYRMRRKSWKLPITGMTVGIVTFVTLGAAGLALVLWFPN